MKIKLFLALCALVVTNAFAQIPTNGLIARYNFDSTNPLQEQINGDNFVQTGNGSNSVLDRFGNNSAYSLNGDHLDRPDVVTTPAQLSLSFWIKTNSTNTNEEVIINDTNSSGTNTFAVGSNTDVGYLITLNNGVIKLRAQSKSESTSNPTRTFRIVTNNSVVVNDGNWHHVYVVINEITSFPGLASINVVIEVDGVLTSATGGRNQNPSSSTFTSIHSTGTMTVGNIQNTLPTTSRYQGAIDDLLIYDRNLTSQERNDIRTVGNYCFAPNKNIVSVTVTGEASASLSINGSANATYDIALHKASEPFANAVIFTNTLLKTSLTQLDASTPYKLYIREQCVVTTGWSSSVDFRTQGKIYINQNATGFNDGSSWANAYTDLQNAISFPAPFLFGQEYWIAGGTYTPSSTNNRNSRFDFLSPNIKVYGGFSGTETLLSDRVLGTNETILSGDLLGDDSGSIDYNNPTKQDNSLRIVNIRGQNTLLDGLTITNAFANGGGANSSGGAIYKDTFVRELTIQNCTISNNISLINGNISGFFTITQTNEVVIDKCDFNNNLSNAGTCLNIFSGSNFPSTTNITVSNSLFNANRASVNSGSSMFILSRLDNTSMNVNLINNTFVNNIDDGATGTNSKRTTVVLRLVPSVNNNLISDISNCIFWDNKARGGVTANAASEGPLNSSSPADVNIFNSIDEDDFSNIATANKTNTSNSNPLFVSATDFTLQSSSPAIDTGDNSKIIGNADLVNNQRIANTTVDMGCYEFGSSPVLSLEDITKNTEVAVTVFPNPASNLLFINSKIKISNTKLFTFNGKQFSAKLIESAIDVSDLQTGVYFLEITFVNGKSQVVQVLKK